MDNQTSGIKCRVCHEEFSAEQNLHKHIKVHKLYLAEYYQTYWPRYDKFDAQIIRFRNKEQYLTTDFNSRDNLRKWVQQTDEPTVRAYLKMALELRKERKKLIWTPTQVELRTAMMAPIQCYNQFFGNYFALCEELGFKNKFSLEGSFDESNKPPFYTIYIDRREQKPLEFVHRPFEFATLRFGDYACSNHDFTCTGYIERKAENDFAGTLSGGVERFCRELDRAVEEQAYVVVLVEQTLTNCLNPERQAQIFKRLKKANADFIFHNVRHIIQKYANVQFLFVADREEAAKMVERIFDSGCSYKTADLQYLHDIGAI